MALRSGPCLCDGSFQSRFVLGGSVALGSHALLIALLDFFLVPESDSVDDHRLRQDARFRPAVNGSVADPVTVAKKPSCKLSFHGVTPLLVSSYESNSARAARETKAIRQKSKKISAAFLIGSDRK
jgi:hypothetical protein